MRVVETVAEMVAARRRWDAGTGEVGLVPTMGYLHAGHVSLVRGARAENSIVAVSIFVNPTQFGPAEDLSRYPRDLPRDLALLEAAGTDVVFTPRAGDVYPAGFVTYVAPTGAVSERLEAASRPGHFRGVATVVAKLFNIVRPDRAYFGQKDAQQVAVLRRMVADLNVPLDLRVLPTVREPDGLAISSRNMYLSEVDRQKALSISRALLLAEGEFRAGVRQTNRLLTSMQRVMLEQHLSIDYVAAVDPITLRPVEVISGPTVLAIAARAGTTRLIDNRIIG